MSRVFLNTMLSMYCLYYCAYFTEMCVFFLVVVNADLGMDGTNVALAVFIPTAVILVVVLGIYIYFAK